MTGWIKLHRKLISWEWYDDTNTFRVFIHLLLKTNYEENKWHGIKINPGQLITGRKKLSEELNLSERQIRTSLNRLKSTNEIAIETTNKFSIVTICKWESFQSEEVAERPTKRPAKRPSSDQQVTTLKELKELKEDKEYTEREFEKFWNIYDKKSDRKKCLNKWTRLNKSEKDKIFETLPNYIKATPDKQYRKNPLTYLNGEVWNDEIILKHDNKNDEKAALKAAFDNKTYRPV